MRVELRLGPNDELTLAWSEEPGARPRSVSAAERSELDALVAAVTQAEREREPTPIIATRRALGRALFELLDGPERALARHLEQAARAGRAATLTVALRGRGVAWLASHPGVRWRWELLADAHGPLMVRRELSLAVQLGEVCSSTPRPLTYGGLRILFMAYSPRNVKPVLDYEGEEERLLAALAPFIEDGRAQVVVVEHGTLDDLGRALLGREFDVVHLSGHGLLRGEGPVLAMEDLLGQVDYVPPSRLLEVLERAAKMPELVMVSSCLSAGEGDGIPSLTAQLVAGGVPTVIGWVQTVRDDLATEAAADIYQRLCTGRPPADAVAFARTRLHAADRDAPASATHTWGTLHLVTRDAAGFVVDRERPPPSAVPLDPGETYRYLDTQGRMRVLETGFVGRRRPLQQTLRVLVEGRVGQRRYAGVVIYGNKGTGKSCLAARAIQRMAIGLADPSALGRIVVHGELDDTQLFAQLRAQAERWQDATAEAMLCDSEAGGILQRLRRVLHGPWARRRLVFVLDDFEQNLANKTDDRARLSDAAAALLEVLVPACAVAQVKLLITTTARFELRPEHADLLVEIGLGGFEPGSLRKLWLRGQSGEGDELGELALVSPRDWNALSERLGRNPRLLDWARTLLRGKSSDEIDEVIAQAGASAPTWRKGRMPSVEEQAELARLFLQHMAYDEAVAQVSADARTFIRRARVYGVPVPPKALEGLCEGLDLDLDRHLTALENLGLLEAGQFDDEPAHRVSPVVEPVFDVDDAEQWQAVAAAFWCQAEHHRGQLERMKIAWRHALAGRCEALAGEVSLPISNALDSAELHHESLCLAEEHLLAFPESEAGLAWAGYALYRAGDPVAGWTRLERAEALAREQGTSGRALTRILREGGRILHALGRLDDAGNRFEEVVDLETKLDHGPSASLASSLHSLAGVLQAQGDLSGARDRLERSYAIWTKVFGTDEHPSVAASLHSLAGLLHAEGHTDEAITTFERVLEIEVRLYGTRDHYSTAETEVNLGFLLIQAGRAPEGISLLRHAMDVFTATAPNHPVLAQLRQLFANAPEPSARPNPADLAHTALDIRRGEPLDAAARQRFEAGLAALVAAGAPHDEVARYLLEVAAGAEPSVPDEGLDAQVRAFLSSVREAALTVDAEP